MRIEDAPPEVRAALQDQATPPLPKADTPVDIDWNHIVQFDSHEEYEQYLHDREEQQQ